VSEVIDRAIGDINNSRLSEDRKRDIKRIINAIDEPIIKFKLAEMFTQATGNREFELKLLDEEIARLQERRGRI
jgi:hypothetical protein